MVQINRENIKSKTAEQTGSGTKYHEEHASKVTGYGEIDPNAERLTNRTDKNSSTS
ncbi:hypothetical protein [Neobacillus kokaensis]|uniref:Uncharacterized protein n=1 Tax=Neobacillus kokaensis TaxID=2759023 RepID=A0ABQ3N2G9_9BACI|nr:hypothetical protein [Neobacillus kokaensis]GHH99140.1 hypothetical protein AM1BK_26830 [Neobacillus kokaensis]